MLLPMLRALTHPWEVNKSPLYRHIPQKPGEKELGARMRQVLLRTIQTEEFRELVQQSPELRKLCEQEYHKIKTSGAFVQKARTFFV